MSQCFSLECTVCVCYQIAYSILLPSWNFFFQEFESYTVAGYSYLTVKICCFLLSLYYSALKENLVWQNKSLGNLINIFAPTYYCFYFLYTISSHFTSLLPSSPPHFFISPSVSAVFDSLSSSNKVGFLMPGSQITQFPVWPCITPKAAGHQRCAHLIPQIAAAAHVLSSPALLFPFIAQLFSGFLSLFFLTGWRRAGEFQSSWIPNDSTSTVVVMGIKPQSY